MDTFLEDAGGFDAFSVEGEGAVTWLLDPLLLHNFPWSKETDWVFVAAVVVVAISEGADVADRGVSFVVVVAAAVEPSARTFVGEIADAAAVDAAVVDAAVVDAAVVDAADVDAAAVDAAVVAAVINPDAVAVEALIDVGGVVVAEVVPEGAEEVVAVAAVVASFFAWVQL